MPSFSSHVVIFSLPWFVPHDVLRTSWAAATKRIIPLAVHVVLVRANFAGWSLLGIGTPTRGPYRTTAAPGIFVDLVPNRPVAAAFFSKSHVGIRFQEICTEVCIVHFMRMICSKAVARTASMSWPERLCESPSGSVQPEGFAEERASAFNLRKGGSWTSGKSACLCDLCVGHVSC